MLWLASGGGCFLGYSWNLKGGDNQVRCVVVCTGICGGGMVCWCFGDGLGWVGLLSAVFVLKTLMSVWVFIYVIKNGICWVGFQPCGSGLGSGFDW